MANNQTNIEGLLIKAFVYKYTPVFTPQLNVTKTLSTFNPYSVDLDYTKFYTKYDISSFVVSYNFEQGIDETTYSWSMELQDLALSYGTIDSSLKVPSPQGNTTTGLAFSNSTDSIERLSEYELNANNDTTTIQGYIETAKQHRGRTPAPLTTQNINNNAVLSTQPGLRLSDLIQEYDFVSVFLYKNTTPLEEVVGTVTFQNPALTNNPIYIFTPNSVGQPLSTANLQYESILLTPMSNGQPLFSNEFNGFVMRKTINSAIGQVDRLSITGNGWSRLFGSTRRVVKPSFFQGSLYEQGQLANATQVSPFQTVFAGKPISYILKDLFDLTFRIDFNQGPTTTSSITLLDSFFNISSLIVGNDYPANLFNLPQYLLSIVMKNRNFAYIEPLSSISFIADVEASLNNQFPGQKIPSNTFQEVIQATDPSNQVLNYAGINPVVVTSEVQDLQAYFSFLAEVFKNFSPDLKTPYEILNEIRALTFVEIFEQPTGQFIVRSPQYNNTSIATQGRSDISMVRSSDLNIVSSSYSSQVENLVTKLFTGYSVPLLPTITGLEQFAYCDGKLLVQNGLMESGTAANPNVGIKKSSNQNVNDTKTTGLTQYASYMMQILNARLKTANISCDLNNTVQVGYTFIDEAKYKFGYISRITKQVIVGGTATMTLGLTYVRDAVPTSTSITSTTNPNLVTTSTGVIVEVDQLPVLTDIERGFTGS